LTEITLLYEDPSVWIYNKPAGVSLLRDRSGADDVWTELKSGPKPYLVHRLDKGTSGVLLVAKDQSTQSRLTRMFAQRTVRKHYLAWVEGTVPEGTREIDLPLCKGRKNRYRIAGNRSDIRFVDGRYHVRQDRDGVPARTLIRPIGARQGKTLLLIKPLTGRTHQIRVHLGWLGWPITGDRLYNPAARATPVDRMFLHARSLWAPGLPHCKAPVPSEFEI
jgi:tRNA pseudouridine32 synthase/23S rRNA pseudouridine746 synthase/23S rRNA pseudouridine1911/1915/1917 synthase